MCGRFDVDARNPQIRDLAAKLPPLGEPVKLGEVFPGNLVMALASDGRIASVRPFRWGFPKLDSKSLIINARAETALQKPMFAHALKKNPIAIPVTGFYEWRANQEEKRKDKFLFTVADQPVFYLAGLTRFFEGDPASDAFVVLTTQANESMQPYHHRMPVLISEKELDSWLGGGRTEYFLKRPQPKLRAALN